MPSLPLLKALGLNFSPNQLDITPGSLVEASNVIIRRDNVIESRRGYALYGSSMGTSTDRCKQLMSYKNKLIRHFSNRLQYENGVLNDGTVGFFDFSEVVNGANQQASILEAQTGLRIKSIEANSNLYLTTSEGIKKISAKSANTFSATSIVQAGGIKALDAEAYLNTTIGDQSSFLPSDAGVAYKIVWGTKDASSNLVLGAPSDPVTILNPLLNLTLKDFSNFLIQLDNTAYTNASPPNNSLITDINYYSSLALPITATSVELKTNLESLVKKLDEDLLFANATGTGTNYNQLLLRPSVGVSPTITAATTSGSSDITVSSATGIAIGMRVEGGTTIQGIVTNVSGTTVTLNTVATSTNSALPVIFHGTVALGGVIDVLFSAGTPGNYFIAGDQINIPADSFKSNGVSIEAINTNQLITSVSSSKITFTTKDYSSSNPLGISGTITNIATVPALGTGDCILTCASHGLKNLQKITISGSNSVPNINGTYTINYLSKDTFSVNLKQSFNTTNGSSDITSNAHGYQAGDTVSFSTAVTGGVAVGTTYYVISTGLTANAFRVSATLNGAAITFTQTTSGSVSKVVGTAGNSATWNILIDGISTAKIESNTFRSIETAMDQSIPATNQELESLKDYYSEILTTLQDFIAARGSNIVNSSVYTQYIESLNVTTNSSVNLEITIPPTVLQYSSASNPYFYQIYRTSIATVSGVSSISDIAIIQEYTQIEEKFPTDAELANGIIIYNDNTPESIAGTGANLYTNERTGEGGLQANDVPPFALDINRFKGYTFFSNTKTRQRKTVTLIGVQTMLDSYNALDPYKLTISNGSITNTYSFVKGYQEATELTCGAAINVASSGTSSYFLLNSVNNQNQYYVWYQLGTSTDPQITQKGIKVPLQTGDTDLIVLQKTVNAINNEMSDFSAYKSVDISSVDTSTNVFNSTGHGLANGTVVSFFSTATLPSYNDGSSESPQLTGSYYVVNSAANSFQISLISGGSPLDINNAGSGTIKALGDSSTSTKCFILNSQEGPATNALLGAGFTGGVFAISTIQQGSGENLKLNYSTTSGSPDVACTNHGFIAGDSITLGASAPLPTSLGGKYYVLASGLTTNTFRISSTVGGTEITFTETTTGLAEFYDKKVLLSSTASVGVAIEETAKSLIRVINQNTSEFINGFYISGTSTTPGTILLEAKDLSSSEFYIVTSNSTIGESFNPDLSPGTIGITTISNVTPGLATITTASNHGLLNGDSIIISNSTSNPSIDGVRQITYLSANQFTIPVSLTSSGTTAVFKSTGVAEVSSNETQPHRVYYSKFQQPEAVPILNYLDIGATDKAILRIFPLRDSLFVFKEDGLYRISGEVAPFTVALFDSSCILIAPDSIAVSNNQIYGWTTQGISTITEAGVNIISRPIDTEILKKASSQFVNFKTSTWGVGYESDNSYTVYTTNETADEAATIGFRYSNLTNSWTTVDKTVTCGLINSADDKLYLGAGDTNYLEKERKDFTRYDYADRELLYSINSTTLASNNRFKFPTVVPLNIGDVIVQTQTVTTFDFNTLLKKLDLDSSPFLSNNYYATLAASVGDNMRTKLTSLATKLDTDLSTTAYSSDIASISGISITTASIANPTKITTAINHGLKTGRYVTIAGNTQADVNGTFQVTVLNNTEFTIPVDLLVLGAGGSFATNDETFADLKTCYNLIINRLNNDLNVSFSNYSEINTETVQESIITEVNIPEKYVTVNLSLDYVIGPIIIFKAIPCNITYAPLTLDDPLGIKHMREATMMFANKAFTKAEMEFSTDLLPEIVSVPFNGDGNGIFGHSNFGTGFFGGGSNSAPFRTFIPRQCQRCRYMNVGFNHQIAREEFAIYGITLTGEIGQSTRAYR